MKDNSNLSKKEIRRAKRRKMQAMAFGLLGAAVLIVLVVLISAGVGIYNLIKPAKEEPVAEKEQIVLKQSDSIEEDLDQLMAETTEDETVVEDEVAEETTEDTEVVAEDEVDTDAIEAEAKEIVDAMTLEEKVAGLFVVTPEILAPNCSNMTELNESFTTALTQYPVGGVVLDAGNMQSDAQLKQLTTDLQGVNANEMFICVVEHGGSDSDLVKSGVLESPIMSEPEIGSSDDAGNAYTVASTIATVSNTCGFNMVFGPVADIAHQSSGYTSKASYGNDVDKICEMVQNANKGFNESEVFNCVQFFPGYGDITSNPTTSRASSSRTKEQIDTEEYPIYKAAITSGTDMVMVSSVAYKSITYDVPACLSEEIVTEMLRGDLGYDGIIITDALNTSAMYNHYKHADMAVMAINAGCDMLYCPGNFDKAYSAVLNAVKSGTITEERIDESLYRIYRVKCSK